jgi:hypothetical protein
MWDLAISFFAITGMVRCGVWGENRIYLRETADVRYRSINQQNWLLVDFYSYEQTTKAGSDAQNDLVAQTVSGISYRPTIIEFTPYKKY